MGKITENDGDLLKRLSSFILFTSYKKSKRLGVITPNF